MYRAVFLIAIIMAAASPAAAAKMLPKCSKHFVAAWDRWRFAEQANLTMPVADRSCRMVLSHGRSYLCNKDGCSRNEQSGRR
jgi:hypothetical protein